MQSIFGAGVARDQRAWDSLSSFNRFRYEIAASPHPAVLRTSTLPIKGRVARRASNILASTWCNILIRTGFVPRKCSNVPFRSNDKAPSHSSYYTKYSCINFGATHVRSELTSANLGFKENPTKSGF